MRVLFAALFSFRFLLLIVAVLAGLWGLVEDTLAGRSGYQSSSVEAVIADRYEPPSYLTVKGQWLTTTSFVRERKRAGAGDPTAEARYLPLMDGTRRMAILVEIGGPGIEAENASVSGVLRPMPRKLQEAVLTQAASLPELAINTEYVLVQGSTPPGIEVWSAIAGGAVLLGLVIFAVTRYRERAANSVAAPMLPGLGRAAR